MEEPPPPGDANPPPPPADPVAPASPPPRTSSGLRSPRTSPAHLVDHLQATLADEFTTYYPVAGRFTTDQHRDDEGRVLGCSISIDCAGQGIEILHAIADGIAIANVIPLDADVPRVVQSFFSLNGAVNYDGHELPLFVMQVTELADVSELIKRLSSPPLRERMLYFSAESLAALKELALEELLAAGDMAGAAAVMRFQALSLLLWLCVTRARRLAPVQETV